MWTFRTRWPADLLRQRLRGWLRRRRRPTALVVGVGTLLLLTGAMAFCAGALAERCGLIGPTAATAARMDEDTAPFWEAYSLVEKYYVDRAAIQPRHMTAGAIGGMLATLGDVGHTTYLSADELQKLENGLRGSSEGIGARLMLRKKRPTVTQVLPGSPAATSGLKIGDVLLAVDGRDVTQLALPRLMELLRGPTGTSVRLRVQRKGDARPVELTLSRSRVDLLAVQWNMVPGTAVAHIAINGFSQEADGQVREAVAKARRRGARGLLLDVRGCPGGLKEQAVAVTSEFLSRGNVFLEQDAQGKRKAVAVRPGGVATDLPVCVLMDESTASSAEIFAAALQDHGRARLVGTRTFGTGTVLKPFLLSDGSAILLAVSQWLTPRGRTIWHRGVQPDDEVALPAGGVAVTPAEESVLDAGDLARWPDPQFAKALQILQEQLTAAEDADGDG